MRKQLTDAMLEKLAAPASGRLEIYDSIVPAMAVRVTAKGAKTFVVRGRVRGQSMPIRVTVGDAEGMKLKDAREKASDILRGFKAGVDPRDVKDQEAAAAERSQALAWESVAALFVEKHAKRNRTWRYTEALLSRATKVWKGRPITEISRADVVALLDTCEAVSVYEANRVLSAIRKLFNWAMLRGLITTTPIAPGMARQGEVKRDRYLTFDEVRLVWKAADRIGQPFGPFVKLLLATGQRRNEVAEARWGAFDLDTERLWTLTPEDTKAKRAHIVPLSDTALGLLADQPRIGDPAVFVFTTTGKTPISGYSKAKTTLDKAIAEVMAAEAKARGQDPAKVKPLPAWRFHDLRRTVGTHMEDALGIPPHIIGSVLNHAAASYKGVTAIYTRGNLIYERRRALVAWSRLLALAVEGGKLWAVVAAILRPETEADAARTDEFRRMVQADEKTWASYRAGLTRPRASNVRSMRGAA